MASELVKVFAGRGLRTILCDRICGKAFERFAYMCAAIATSHLMRHPLRDAIRLAYGLGNLDALLKEALAVGRAAGFAPDELRVKAYSKAFSMVGRPVDVPPGFDDDGRAGEEAAYLLAEMVGLARRVRVQTPRFDSAWQSIARPKVIDGSATVCWVKAERNRKSVKFSQPVGPPAFAFRRLVQHSACARSHTGRSKPRSSLHKRKASRGFPLTIGNVHFRMAKGRRTAATAPQRIGHAPVEGPDFFFSLQR